MGRNWVMTFTVWQRHNPNDPSSFDYSAEIIVSAYKF
jgi:hypothetical protein